MILIAALYVPWCQHLETTESAPPQLGADMTRLLRPVLDPNTQRTTSSWLDRKQCHRCVFYSARLDPCGQT